MGELISQEELDRAFDARFPKEMQVKLRSAKVAIAGLGGLGSNIAVMLARSGIGKLLLVDFDVVDVTNLNRQIIATRKTVGQYKVDVMKERILDINPDAVVNVHKCFFLPENAAEFPFEEYDYVIDAVDTVTAKIELILRAKETNTPVSYTHLDAADD